MMYFLPTPAMVSSFGNIHAILPKPKGVTSSLNGAWKSIKHTVSRNSSDAFVKSVSLPPAPKKPTQKACWPVLKLFSQKKPTSNLFSVNWAKYGALRKPAVQTPTVNKTASYDDVDIDKQFAQLQEKRIYTDALKEFQSTWGERHEGKPVPVVFGPSKGLRIELEPIMEKVQRSKFFRFPNQNNNKITLKPIQSSKSFGPTVLKRSKSVREH